MFSKFAKIDSKLLEQHFNRIKTGLPGVWHVKLKSDATREAGLNNLPKDFSKGNKNV
ncbi:MAG: hypothetical protein U9Q33_04250 [Campylobacterota bacterium]|nr:hypothetical protein [Campylobacterota bacterium]